MKQKGNGRLKQGTVDERYKLKNDNQENLNKNHKQNCA